jgi:hypothetical protein
MVNALWATRQLQWLPLWLPFQKKLTRTIQ